jgi:1-acyl-sn-glycerol-3-phosphate acyltransferase
MALWLRSSAFFLVHVFWAVVPAVLFVWVVLLPQKFVFKAIRYWQWQLSWFEAKILGLTYRIEGAENIPDGPCIIASKHQSAWETCKLNILFENPAIVLKKELTYLPIWGWYAWASGLIPIDRKAGVKALSKMRSAAEKAKAQGRKIVIFPQGTRLKPREKKPYKSGVAALYRDLNVPIVPMALNSGLFWGKGAFLKKSGVVTIRFLPPIPAGLSRQEMMQRLETELEAACEKIGE